MIAVAKMTGLATAWALAQSKTRHIVQLLALDMLVLNILPIQNCCGQDDQFGDCLGTGSVEEAARREIL